MRIKAIFKVLANKNMVYMQIRNKTIVLSFLLGLSFCIHAQTDNEEYVQAKMINFFEFSLDPSTPVYSFKDKLDRNMFGFSLAYLRQRKAERYDFFGIELSYAHMGSITADFFEFEDRTGSNLINVQLLYRYYPDFFFWRIEPFIEAKFGPQWMYTQTTTTSFIDDSSNLIFEHSDMGLAYAVGLGFTGHIASQVFLLAKINYNGGTSVTYYVPGEYTSGLPIDNFTPETSPVNYLNWQLGISVSF